MTTSVLCPDSIRPRILEQTSQEQSYGNATPAFLWPIAQSVVQARLAKLAMTAPAVLQWLDQTDVGARRILTRQVTARLVRQRVFSLADRISFVRRLQPRIEVTGNLEQLSEGCVLALFRAPWGRVAAKELISWNVPLMAGNRWAATMKDLHVPPTFQGFRRMVRHLRGGGVGATVMDKFVPQGGVRVRFLGFNARVLPIPIQFGVAAQVPVVPTSLQWHEDRLNIHLGPSVEVGSDAIGKQIATETVLKHFEPRVMQDPAGWSRLLPFLRHAFG